MNNDQQLIKIQDNINSLIKAKSRALPKNFNQTRFVQNAMTVLMGMPEIGEIEAPSVARTILKGAFLGLDFFNKECYAIPYKKNVGTKQAPRYITELHFQTDYKGEIKLAKKYSLKKIRDIYAKVVRVGDIFNENIINGCPSINFTPKPFNDSAPVVGLFAVCLYEDGGMIYETISKEEVEHIRSVYSKAADSKAWRESWCEMAKKTVLRRLCKLIELDFENAEQDQSWDDGSDMEIPVLNPIKEPIKMPVALPADDVPAPQVVSKSKAKKPVKEVGELFDADKSEKGSEFLLAAYNLAKKIPPKELDILLIEYDVNSLDEMERWSAPDKAQVLKALEGLADEFKAA